MRRAPEGRWRVDGDGATVDLVRRQAELAVRPFSALAQISAKIRKNYITTVLLDRVPVEISPHDLTRGRILAANREPTTSG